jgi:uncharacterized protein (TIGR02466 family)
MVEIRTLFVTEVLQTNLNDRPLIEALRDATRSMALEDRAGKAWCKTNGYGGYTSYASLDDLPTRYTDFAELKRRLDRLVTSYANHLALDLGSRRLRLDSLWVNILKPGAGHSGHLHPHSVISGTCYLAVPPGSGGLRFEDPRLAALMASPTRRPDAAEHQKPFVTLDPADGDVFLWESWLRHEVMPNKARTARISASFNYGWG